MKQETLNSIQQGIRDIRKALTECDEFFHPNDKHGGDNTHGWSTAEVILQHLMTDDNCAQEKLSKGLECIKALDTASGLGNHLLKFVIEQLSMTIDGYIMSELEDELGEIAAESFH